MGSVRRCLGTMMRKVVQGGVSIKFVGKQNPYFSSQECARSMQVRRLPSASSAANSRRSHPRIIAQTHSVCAALTRSSLHMNGIRNNCTRTRDSNRLDVFIDILQFPKSNVQEKAHMW